MKNFFAEFKKFITRGNVLDMSVGVIVGGAFTAIVNGLSNFVLKPIINWLLALVLGKGSLSEVYTFLGEPAYKLAEDGVTQVVDLANSFYIDWGAFINAIINFLLIAIVLFSIVRIINKMKESGAEAKKDRAEEKEAVKKYRGQGISKKEAVARYRADLKRAEEEKAAAEKAAADAAAAAEAAKEKEMDVLKDIRELLRAQAGKAE
ncbi:MAG: large conductance mechanosensitive channel protein MscL [Clostridia bacterium]|nr:large conductance mechanosensitive channel protein MscL [Clostridia bacterium]MBR6773316.1 large conductance mechanosensitive channel protein MscL [Clostridia bacterium]